MEYREFSIKDLESFSGIKAHTIRIWEQRYGILAPVRTDTNIRKYSESDLKTLLNVSTLNNMGFKISKIAQMKEQEMSDIILNKLQNASSEQYFQQMLKIAMVNYDEELFHQVSEQYIKDHGMVKTFSNLFVPFMEQIGVLWHAGAICPSNEHFISNLIRQKIISRIDAITTVSKSKDIYVLYLPQNEIHDITLLMLHYYLRASGYRSIFLGLSVPYEDLKEVVTRLGAVNFVSIFTTHPLTKNVNDYFGRILKDFENSGSHFFLTGYALEGISTPDSKTISIFQNAKLLSQVISSLEL
ncbi:MAG: MerR family transcriptional regulator [Flavobacteriales bacterium]|nr:MerR family transcriptional regulator [Flavobacteriales bacterium]